MKDYFLKTNQLNLTCLNSPEKFEQTSEALYLQCIETFSELVEHFICLVLYISLKFYHSPEKCATETVCSASSEQLKLTFRIKILN